jgi:hypothetical protein
MQNEIAAVDIAVMSYRKTGYRDSKELLIFI